MDTTSSDIVVKARGILQHVFGLQEFRGFQADVIETLVSGRDALVLMPTGGGKSLCYQIPALMREGVAVVVSPLIALMADQVASLEQVGVKAEFLNSTLSFDEVQRVKRDVAAGRVKLLYVAPERLVNQDTRQLLKRTRVSLFAIDEAHCVSMWGHDFRPEYGTLSFLKKEWPEVPRVALTATADLNTREEICERLLIDPCRFVASFDRPNIRYRVVEKTGRKDTLDELVKFIQNEHPGQCGVVYCLARATTEAVEARLQEAGITALAYHAGMDARERSRRQSIFLQEDGVVMVATIAFGMGIDKPDVRFVAHVDMPKSIENYFQETGRAGRDGLAADAWMAYGLQDVVNQRRFIETSEGDPVYKRRSISKLESMLALAETVGCRRQLILSYFDEDSKPCGNCDNCLEPPVMVDATDLARKFVSCVWRCKQASGTEFGALHIIDVLRGEATEKVLANGHDKLSTFGIGKDTPVDAWRRLLRQLIVKGILKVDAERFNVLVLGDDREEVKRLLKGEVEINMRQEGAKMRRKKQKVSAAEALSENDEKLFQRLRGWRKEVAHSQDKPSYMIFPDTTLAAIARMHPKTHAALYDVPGVGDAKLEHYGDAVIEIVRNFDEASETDEAPAL